MVKLFDGYAETRIVDPASHPFYREWRQRDQIFIGRTRRFETGPIRGVVSLRTARHGNVRHMLGDVPIDVGPDHYLLLDHGREYAVEIDATEPVESFSVHLSSTTVSEVVQGLTAARLDELLDGPHPRTSEHFVDRLYPVGDPVGTRLLRLRERIVGESGLDPLEIEEAVLELARVLVERQRDVVAEADRITAARPGTRIELYRRLHRAADFLETVYDRPVRVGDAARAACMSRFHFQRAFRTLFRCSVHEYLTSVRLARARALLAGTDDTVESIAERVGFAHHSSFTRAFGRRHAVSPRAYRSTIRTVG